MDAVLASDMVTFRLLLIRVLTFITIFLLSALFSAATQARKASSESSKDLGLSFFAQFGGFFTDLDAFQAG